MQQTIVSMAPALAVLVSLIGAFLIVLFSKKPNLRESVTIITALTKFLIVASMLPIILNGDIIEYTLFTLFKGLDIKFRVDAFGILFATTASFLWIITSVYSIGYVRSLKEHAQTRYFFCFAIALSSAMGVAFAANLLTLFIFYEILTISTYPLVIHKETKGALSAGTKYFGYLLTTSIIFQLTAIVLVYSLTGTLEFSERGILAGHGGGLLTLIFFMFIIGYTKAAIMPLHSWLPTAMIAPTPVSALLHAVAVVKVGVFSILRIIFYIFGIDLLSELGLGIILAYFVSFTILLASIYALTHDNLKMRLAYSTISQLSYIVLGAALLSPSGIIGGVMHIVNHGFAKITLFFCAGSIYIATRKTNISEMNGIGRKMPITMFAFAIASLGMVGIPFTGGFISKWFLALGSIEAGQIPILIVLLVSSILNAAYFFPVVYTAFVKELPEGDSTIKEPSLFVTVPLTLTAIGSVILGLYPSLFLELAKAVMRGVT
ncbi:MAG: monovalent cation/H+ antiporter subunit D family protein [Candidatus Desulfatibia sp.]|uniref:monovalent cation/H+ antiporter subunit D family protein n=1 Tax=Candidatus Desulfatibia sp. TaxID=3101189 RepID=UPI002F32BE04